VSVRFYVDADLLGVAHVLADLRADVTYPGDPGGTVKRRNRPPCPVQSPGVPDHEWLPEVGRNGWAVLTRDRRIERRPAEKQAVIAYGVKLFAITSAEQLDKWRQLEIIMSRWRDVERLAGRQGPFIYRLTRTSVTPLLPPPS